MLNEITDNAEYRMKKSIELLNHDLAKLRTGRAHPSILNGVSVEYYGQATPLHQVSNVTVEDSRTIVVTPFEKHMIQVVDKAIRSGHLGLNPVIIGQVIRIPLPPLTEERRIDLSKQVKASAEATKVAIRNIRRDANTQLKKSLKEKCINKDQERSDQESIQKLTNQYVANVERVVESKEMDLMQF